MYAELVFSGLTVLVALVAAPAGASNESACAILWEARVVDADTEEGVPDARIQLQVSGQAKPRTGETNDDGRIRVEGLCPGTMRVFAASPDHAAATSVVELVDVQTRTTIRLQALHEHHSHRVVVVHDSGLNTIGSTEHLAGAELARTRGQGLADAISGMAGVTTLRSTGGGMAQPVIRGQIGRRNLIVFDGVRHEGQKWGLDHPPEVDPYAAGRISVIKGAATTRFGSDAIGGVVLVDPRPLLRAPGMVGQASTVGYSNPLGGGGAFQLDHAPARVKGLAWRAEANISRHRATLTPDYPMDNTGVFGWNVGGRIGYLRDRFDLIAGYRLMRNSAGICTCLRISTPEEFQHSALGNRPVGVDRYSPEFAIERAKQDIWHHVATARARVELRHAGELHATYAYQFNDRREFDIVREHVKGPQLTFQLGTHTGELRYEHVAVPLGRRWTLVGTIAGHASHQTNEFRSATSLIPDYRQVSGGVFVVERFVHDRLELEIGGRYEALGRTAALDQRDYLGRSASGRLDEAACTRANDGGADCKHVFHAPSATASMLARPIASAPELNVRLELNSSARVPAIDEQFIQGAAPSLPILSLGNSRLGIERTWGAAVTLQYDRDWLFAEASGYSNYIDDYIYFTPEPQTGDCAPLTCTVRGPLPAFAFKPTDALFAGAELRFELLTPGLPFKVLGNASWVRATDLTHDRFLTLIPSDRYELAGRYLWPDSKASSRGYLELTGTFVDRQRRFDREAEFAAPPGAYFLLGAGVGVEFPAKRHVMRLDLRGTNLLNHRYRTYTSLLRYFSDEAGWALQLRFSIEFSLER